MAYYSVAFLAIAASFLASASAVELTEANFSEMTAGKTVFLKFFAPWCGHCKSMAADWSKLEKDFEGHAIALIGSVDCTDDAADPICEEFNVEGFPTLMWGDVSSMETYEGDRVYKALKAFADENVTTAKCSIFNIDVCSDIEKADIALIDAKSDQELLDAAEKISTLAKLEDKMFESFVDKIQKEYEQKTKEHNAIIDKIKAENNFKLVEMVLKKRNIKNPFKNIDEDDDDDDDDDDMLEGEL